MSDPRDAPLFSPAAEALAMTASWADLFERGAAYDVALEELQGAADDLPTVADTAETDDG